MSRLGCTARCRWCGALCWGQRGHEEDQGETRKHHSSHQPQGLGRSFYMTTYQLMSRPCHEVTDEIFVHFGDYFVSGMSWQEAKAKHFSDWKFDKHYISKFDELMRWFFPETAPQHCRKFRVVETCNCRGFEEIQLHQLELWWHYESRRTRNKVNNIRANTVLARFYRAMHCKRGVCYRLSLICLSVGHP